MQEYRNLTAEVQPQLSVHLVQKAVMQKIFYLSFSEIDEPLSLADRGRVSPDSVEQQLPLLV